MRNKIKAILTFVCCIAVCLCFVACQPTDVLTITGRTEVTISVGQTYIIKANTVDTSAKVEWKSSDDKVAFVDANGKVVGVAAGTAEITASTAGVSKSVNVTVVDDRSYAVNINGETLRVNYGDRINRPADPVKKADAQYTYTFVGWYVNDAEYDFNAPVTSNLVIEARYAQTLNKYNVNVGGSEKEYEYGALVEKPADPEKESTAAFDYAFIGWYVVGEENHRWNFGGEKVTGDLELEARFIDLTRSYEVTFDGKASRYVKYGEKIEKPENPVMANTAEYSYVFAGWYNGDEKWDFENDTVAADTNLVAKFDEKKNSYDVTIGENTRKYEYGKLVTKPLDPKKEEDAQYRYTFAGWYTENGNMWKFDSDIVTGNLTLVARFNAIVKNYTVTIDGKATEYAYGAKVARPAAPVKEADDEFTYYFDKFVVAGTETEWNFDKDVVTGNVELTAVFKTATNRYLVSFDDFRFSDYAYGALINKPEDPTKQSDALYDYFFSAWTTADGTVWDFDKDTVTGDVKLYAAYERAYRRYSVAFECEGTEFAKSAMTSVGSAIQAPATQPEKTATYKNTYTFAGWYTAEGKQWNFESDLLNGPLTLYARFNANERKYTVSFDGVETEYSYGAKIAMPADPVKTSDDEEFNKQFRYEFSGWYVGDEKFVGGNVTENLELVSKFDTVERYFEVTFYNEADKVMWTSRLKYGEKVASLVYPEKAPNARYTYKFAGWTNGKGGDMVDFTELTATEDVEYYPVFETIVNRYTVTLKNYDGTIFVSDADMTFEYEAQFSYPATAEIPLKIVADSDDAYAFVYWSKTPDGEEYTGNVTGNMTLYAVYIIDNNKYSVEFYDYSGEVMTENTLTDLKRNEILVQPDMYIADTNTTMYEFLGWATEPDGEVLYAAGNAIRCNGDMKLYAVYETTTKTYTVSVALTDADANYVLTDVEGNPLTAEDLVFEYNNVFRFKAAINSESKGEIRIMNGVNVLIPDAEGVYSLNVRDQLRFAISGLTLRRYTITADVSLVKQSATAWAKIADSYDDIIIKLTKNGEAEYIENAIVGGKVNLTGLTAGEFKVEFVYKDTTGAYRTASNYSFTETLNAAWAIENGQDETMTWGLGAVTAGYVPFSATADYKLIDGVLKPEEYKDQQNPRIKFTEFNPGENDFATIVSYHQPRVMNNEGPSIGFIFGTADGSAIEIYMFNEGKIRIVGGSMDWENRFDSGKLLCGTGAILNQYGDCYSDVTLRYVKKGNLLYIVGDYSRPNSNVVAWMNKLFGVIDVSTGTLYMNSEMDGSSQGNGPVPTGVYKTFQNDSLKSLANIQSVEAYYGITKAQPVEISGLNYSYDEEVIDSYAALGFSKFNITTDDHSSYRISSNIDMASKELPVWKSGTITFVTDEGYIIDKLLVNGKSIAFTVNDNYQITLDYAIDYARAGVYSIEVTTKAGQYTKATGKIGSENGNIEGATVRFIGNGKTLEGRTDASGAYSVIVESNSTYTMEVVKDGYFDKTGSVNVGAAFEKDVELVKKLFSIANNAGNILFENVKYGLDDMFAPTDVTYTVVANDGSNTQLKSDKFLGNGQYFIYTLRFNPESNGYPGHAVKVGNNQQWGDQYMRIRIGGKEFGFNSSGCTFNGDGTTITGKQPFDFAMGRDFWQNNPIYVAAYDFAVTKDGNALRMYARYNGTTDWVHIANATTDQAIVGFDPFLISTWGGYTYNWSLTNLVIGNNIADITDHEWDYTLGLSWYGSQGRTTKDDGSHVYTLHANTSGATNKGSAKRDAVAVPLDDYNAKDNVVVAAGDYTIYGNSNWWSLAGWVFRSTDGRAISIMIRSGDFNRFYLTTAGLGNGYPNRTTNLTTAEPTKGLYVCNATALPCFTNKTVKFSAKWEINGYRFKLYVGDYGKEATKLIFDIDWKEYWSTHDPSDGDNRSARRWGGSDANSVDKKFPDMSKLQIGVEYCCDDADPNWSKNLIYVEKFTVTTREVYMGQDVNLSGPAYKLYTDWDGEPVIANAWYAEADFSGSVSGNGWAGFITDMCGNKELDVSDADVKNNFYSVGYGYGTLWTHKDDNWIGGTNRGGFTVGTNPLKLGVARMGKKYYVFLNGNYIKSFDMGTDAPSAMGIYCGVGELSDVSITGFNVDFDFDQNKLDEMLAGEKVTVSINGNNYNLNRASLGGAITVDGTTYDSFNDNYQITGKGAGKSTGIGFMFVSEATANIAYIETTFSNMNPWHGIIANCFGKPDAGNDVGQRFYGFGAGYPGDTSTQLYAHFVNKDVWAGNGDKLADLPYTKGTGGSYRLGVARINDWYYVFIDGELLYSMQQAGYNGTASDNLGGFGLYFGGPGSSVDFSNTLYTTDEKTVRALISKTTSEWDTPNVGTGRDIDAPIYLDGNTLISEYVVSGKLDVTGVGNGNRYLGWMFGNGDRRFLFWDGDANNTFEYAYSDYTGHIHKGNLAASEYFTFNGTKSTCEWKVLHDGKNAYFFIDGTLKLIYANAPKDVFKLENNNVNTKFYDITAATASVNAEVYQAACAEVAEYASFIDNQNYGAQVLRVADWASYMPVPTISSNAASGTVYSTRYYGATDNFVWSGKVVIEEAGGNAHMGLEFGSDNNRFLFWNTGSAGTFKACWAYDVSEDAKYKYALTGEYEMKIVVKNRCAYWFINGELKCAIKVECAGFQLRFENIKGRTENCNVVAKNSDEAAFNAAIEGLDLPAITGSTRF